MKDQVQQLVKRNISAVALYSGLRQNEMDRLLDNCTYGQVKFLYISPERLFTERFLIRLLQLPLTLIAVDEAHCISQWGYDFRPAYLKIADIRTHFPKPTIHRRNTGYAVDYLLETEIFTEKHTAFDFCKLICGSEGTLAIATEIKLHLDPLPDPFEIVVAAHFESIHQSMKAAQIAMKHQPSAVELMDKISLDCTNETAEQSKNMQFV
jgi:hypothetical protein